LVVSKSRTEMHGQQNIKNRYLLAVMKKNLV